MNKLFRYEEITDEEGAAKHMSHAGMRI